jgi:hypothetical protein
MTPRLIAGVIFCMIAGATTVGMVLAEEIEPGPQKAKAVGGPTDALAGLQYNPSARESNFKSMGFDAGQITKIMAEISGLEQRLHIGQAGSDQIAYLIEQTDDSNAIENAFCGRYAELPSRYAAMEFLVDESQGELRVRDLAQMNQFDAQDWWGSAHALSVVAAVELVSERHEDATRMGLAAVLARQAEAVTAGKAPWGTSLWNNWSWEDCAKRYESVGSKLIRYAASMHLVLENANGEAGICVTE